MLRCFCLPAWQAVNLAPPAPLAICHRLLSIAPFAPTLNAPRSQPPLPPSFQISAFSVPPDWQCLAEKARNVRPLATTPMQRTVASQVEA